MPWATWEDIDVSLGDGMQSRPWLFRCEVRSKDHYDDDGQWKLTGAEIVVHLDTLGIHQGESRTEDHHRQYQNQLDKTHLPVPPAKKTMPNDTGRING